MPNIPATFPAALTPASLHDQLNLIRDHYTKALELAHADLPQSSATEEIIATRKLNDLILDLSKTPTLKIRKSV